MSLFVKSLSFLLLFIVRVKNPYYEYRNRKPKLKIKYFVNLRKNTGPPPPPALEVNRGQQVHTEPTVVFSVHPSPLLNQ